MTLGRPSDSQPGEQESGFVREDTSPGVSASDTDPTPLDRSPEDEATAPEDGHLVVKEFSLSGAVPRSEPSYHPVQTQDIYVRLENTIYGPLSGDELAAMLASGEFTGYESASSDLQHWTPLLYHPRMNLTGSADPDATHALLHGHSTLPAASRAGSRIRLEDFADEPPPERAPSVPLAQIMLRPAKATRRTARGVDLPVYAEVKEEKVGGVATTQPSDEMAPESRSGSDDLNFESDSGPFLDDADLNAQVSDLPPAAEPAPAAAPGPDAAPAASAVHDSAPDVAFSRRPEDTTDQANSIRLPAESEQAMDAPVPPAAAPAEDDEGGFSIFEVTVMSIIVATAAIVVYWLVFRS